MAEEIDSEILNLESKVNSKKILHVDDDEEVRKITMEVLGARGYEIGEFSNYKTVLNEILEYVFSYDVLLFDCLMPEGNGVDLAIIAREMGYENKIIIYSGNTGSCWTPEIGKQYNLTLLKKPARVEELYTAIEGIELKID
ncbi:MAG: response regulator [Nanoarchaeota archaeon]|nr:response regulator [Nanoarchaeota archaeon]